jgi:carbamoyl-phosphate synthase large subunit
MVNANVLVTAAGGIVAQGIIKSLKLANKSDKGLKYRIIAADMNAQAAGLYRCHKGVLLPPATSTRYVESLLKIVKQEEIAAIFVGSDEEIPIIGDSRQRIESETNAKVLVSPKEVLNIARDKWKTYLFLKENTLDVAASTLPENADEFVREFKYPIVVKPREGYGSKNFHVVRSHSEMHQAISNIQRDGWHPIIQEFIDENHAEYTSGVTIDRRGEYVMSSVSIQKTLKGGQTYKALIDDYEDVRKPSEEVGMKLGGIGAINIQAKLVRGRLKIFEINPRFSATCPMRSVAGVNEPDIVYRNTVLGEEIKLKEYKRLVCMRYWNEVYISFHTYEGLLRTGAIGPNDSLISDYF